MANKRQKGNAFQDWIAAWLVENRPGAVIHNQKTVSKLVKIPDKRTGLLRDTWVSARNDIFGCVDLIVCAPGEPMCFIQATMDNHIGKRQKELLTVPWPWDCCSVELWLKRKVGEIHIKRMSEDGEFHDIGKILRRNFYRLEQGELRL